MESRAGMGEPGGAISVEAAYAHERAETLRPSLVLGVAILLLTLAAVGVLQHRADASRSLPYGTIYVLNCLLCGLAIWRTRRTNATDEVCLNVAVVAVVLECGLMTAYGVVVQGELEVLAMGLISLFFGTMVFFPWGGLRQLLVCGSGVGCFLVAQASGMTDHAPAGMLAVGMIVLSCVSVGGAVMLDRYRFALFAQAFDLEKKNRDLSEARQTLERREQMARIVTGVSTRFINVPPQELDQKINQTLQTIGEFAGADRCYMFQVFEGDIRTADRTNEWCAEGVSSLVEDLQGVTEDQFQWIYALIAEQQVVQVRSVADLPPEAETERALFQKAGTRSSLVVPMVHYGAPVGFIGLDAVRAEKTWPGDITGMLKIVGGILSNVLERKRAEHSLQDSEERFRQLADNASEVFWLLDVATEKLLYVSPAFEELWGQPLARVYEHMESFLEGVHPDDQARMASQIARIRPEAEAGEAREAFEYRVTRPDGSLRWVRLNVFPVSNEQGEIYRLGGIIQDITEQKQAEEAHGLFLAATSHDVRDALNAIAGYATVVGDTLPSGDTNEPLGRIISLAQALSEMMGEIVAHADVAGQRLVTKGPVSIRTLLADCSSDVDKQCRDKGLQLRLDLPEDEVVLMDRVKVARILQNLLSNAVRYTAKGEVELRAELAMSELRLIVRDTGIGIPEEELSHIFEEYYRHEQARETVQLGTGLGLATVKRFCDLLGGEVSVDSTPGVGSSFRVVIPRQSPDLGTAHGSSLAG